MALIGPWCWYALLLLQPQFFLATAEMPFTLSSSVHSFDPRPNDRFQASCIRYFIPQSCITPSTSHLASDDSDAITFILAHGTGFHKEQLGPMLEDLFELLIGARGSVKVKDAWVIDAPNHGDSAMLNEKVLPPNEGYNELCTRTFP